jgi:hypothetical protein
LGFNQLDDKGAFIDQSRVCYGDWGEAYGRGLAQAEDEIAFKTMIEGVGTREEIQLCDLIATIDGYIAARRLADPIVIQSLSATFEMEGINQNNVFIPNYRVDCPQTSLNEINGFMGVFKRQDKIVPVFDLFVHGEEAENKVLLVDLSRFSVFQQFSPIENADDEQYRVENLLVRVLDLNRRQTQRERILDDDPDWLHEQDNPERYLRSRVIVNVFEKFKVKVVDRARGICISIADPGV